MPGGYNIAWSGQYEYMIRAQERLMIVVPMTLLIIFVIIYLNTRSVVRNVDRPAVPAPVAGRRVLASVPARLQHEHRGLDRNHRTGRSRGRNRCRDAALPECRIQRCGPGGTHAEQEGFDRRDFPWRRDTVTTQDHDGQRDHGGFASHHVECRNGGGRHEADRHTHGRRRRDVPSSWFWESTR